MEGLRVPKEDDSQTHSRGSDSKNTILNIMRKSSSCGNPENSDPEAFYDDAPSDHIRQISGAGLDYRSWNGAVLQGPSGALFGLRVGFIEDGKLITGPAFYDKVARVGDYAPGGNYACLTTERIKLEWRKDGAELYGMVSAKSAVQIVVELYAAHDYSGNVIPAGDYIPFRNQATFHLLGKRKGGGSSPIPEIAAGDTFVTGGHARVTGRRLEPGKDSKKMDYFGIEFACEPLNSYSGDPAGIADCFTLIRDGIAKTGPADKMNAGFWVDQQKITYFYFMAEPGKHIAFKAATAAFPFSAADQIIDRDISAAIQEARVRFNHTKIDGAGALAGWTRPMLNEISWMKMLHPFENKIVIPAGRPWMLDGRYNCWGWDENFNAMIAAVEDPDTAENCLLWALGCERIGPLAAWSVYCRQPNIDLLKKVYPAYKMIYPPANSDLVTGQPGWKSGPCRNGNVGKGMDDTPMRERSRNLGLMFSLDMSCMKAWSIEILWKMAAELCLHEDAAQYRKDLGEIREKINETFWMDGEGMYRNRYTSGEWSVTESPTSFYPWLAGCPSQKQSEEMLRNVKNPTKFWGPHVLPTLSRQDPEYGKPSFELHNGQTFPPYSYWRGAIWPPTNFLVYEGLKRYQLDDAAAELALKSVSLWGRNWDANGWACENYDPETGERTMMSHTHQSWAMLLPLMGVKELIDIEWWNHPAALRFGSLAEGNHEVRRVPMNRHLMDFKQGNGRLELKIDQNPILRIDGGKPVIRNFALHEKGLQFQMRSSEQTTVLLFSGSAREQRLTVPAGKHQITSNEPEQTDRVQSHSRTICNALPGSQHCLPRIDTAIPGKAIVTKAFV
jgi:hypothetical protein